MARKIPVHFIKEDSDIEVMARHILPGEGKWGELASFAAHCDDCYTFILLVGGEGSIDLDFETTRLRGGQLGIMRPWQVHSKICARECEAWMLRVAPAMMHGDYNSFIDRELWRRPPLTPDAAEFATLQDAFKMLVAMTNRPRESAMRRQLVFNALNVVLGLVSALLIADDNRCGDITASRHYEISAAFSAMLPANVRQNKNPSFYAGKMCITENYLNEAVKRATGMTVSALIRSHVILEAKRQLCFTANSVRHIADALGYYDNAYFSRIFKQATGRTPLEFRREYLK